MAGSAIHRSVILEHVGLIWYSSLMPLVENPWIAAGLYVLDNAFFAISIARKTYFQKIAVPGDIAPTSVVAFSINQLPRCFCRFRWVSSGTSTARAVFVIGAAMAGVALCLSLFVPHDPNAGNETIFATRRLRAAAAE